MNDERERSSTDQPPISISIVEALQGVESYLVEKSVEEFDVEESWSRIERLIDAEAELETDDTEDPGAEPPAAQFNSAIKEDNVIAFPDPHSSSPAGQRCASTQADGFRDEFLAAGARHLAAAAALYITAVTTTSAVALLVLVSHFSAVFSMAVAIVGVLSVQGLCFVVRECRHSMQGRRRFRTYAGPPQPDSRTHREEGVRFGALGKYWAAIGTQPVLADTRR
ncbi:hypothetical protein [Nocardia brasiliensis]|uniref:hypothetical protein n=1 Tax=Nocardia brasiliensis TaxID=37326 RepID=UPI0018938CD0|nr:hypothetical protein [Nocardia brasiliensis]MBF6548838.1 hypothetical protein [Nocardia brasiliensis]